MAISLATLNTRAKPKPPLIAVYGVGGIGKTTLAAGAEAPVFIWAEDGAGKLDVPGWRVHAYAEVTEALGVLYTEEHQFKTLVVDSADWLETLIWGEACSRNGWKTIEDGGYGKGYVAALSIWKEYLEGLNALRDERGMTIIQIAHADIKRFDSPESEPFDRYIIKLHNKASALLQEHADIVAFLNYRVSLQKADVGFNKKVARAVGGGQRVLYLEERPAFLAKNRYGLPPSIDLPTTPEAWKQPEKIWAALGEYLPVSEHA